MKRRRPVFFDLTRIQMPVGAVTSIAHRASGILLALCLPYLLYLFQLSLQGPDGYQSVVSLFHITGFKAAVLLFIWALAHHLLAGIRHLLSDIDIGSRLHAARASAWFVNCCAVAFALLGMGALW
jgi:succinate dehydrogenase / fumarate reductase cytochrome b subunit